MATAGRQRGAGGWAVVLGAALLVAVMVIVWVLANRTTVEAPDVALTAPPIDLPSAPLPPGPSPTPDPLPTPTPGPT